MTDYYSKAKELFDYTRDLRRDFHVHPELGFQEYRTAGIVARELNKLGLEVTTGIGKTGVVALLEGAKPGPVALLRFDMDALPIDEETGAEYASQTPGVMHACGHDAHTSIGLTVARLLNDHRDELSGTVKFVFQPAEEGLGGAERMVKEGVLQNPVPDLSLALHIWNDRPYGWIGVTDGPAMAASNSFLVKIGGRGGHGASPHQTRDPIVASAQIITALQSIVARNVPPLESGVISITAINGGTAFNIIPEEVVLKGTMRSYKIEVMEMMVARTKEIVESFASSMGCEGSIEITEVSKAVSNDIGISERVRQVAGKMFPDWPVENGHRTMGSEDMSYMMDEIPGCYFFVGSNDRDAGKDYPHHHPKFDFDEDVLPTAAGLMAAAAAEVLRG